MTTVFLSYSKKDHHFAELVGIKLAESNISVWRDQGQLRAGTEWRAGIERGISDSIAVVVALSQNSVESSFVTFEWAYGLGKGKPVIPLKLDACEMHLRLEPIQYLDFSVAGALPWNLLVERIREIETDATSADDLEATTDGAVTQPQPLVESILAYLRQRGFQYVSFDRIRRKLDPSQSDQMLDALVKANPSIFLPARLKEGKVGLKKLVP